MASLQSAVMFTPPRRLLRRLHVNAHDGRMGWTILARSSAMIASLVACLPYLLRSSKYRRGECLVRQQKGPFAMSERNHCSRSETEARLHRVSRMLYRRFQSSRSRAAICLWQLVCAGGRRGYINGIYRRHCAISPSELVCFR